MGAKIAALLIKSITFLTIWLLSTTSLLKLRCYEACLGGNEKGMRNKTEREPSLLFLPLLPLLLFKLYFHKNPSKA